MSTVCMPPIYNELFAAMEQKDVFMFLSELRFGSFFLNLLFTGWCIIKVNLHREQIYGTRIERESP